MSERTWIDWGVEIEYWVPEGGEGPDVRWPDNWGMLRVSGIGPAAHSER